MLGILFTLFYLILIQHKDPLVNKEHWGSDTLSNLAKVGSVGPEWQNGDSSSRGWTLNLRSFTSPVHLPTRLLPRYGLIYNPFLYCFHFSRNPQHCKPNEWITGPFRTARGEMVLEKESLEAPWALSEYRVVCFWFLPVRIESHSQTSKVTLECFRFKNQYPHFCHSHQAKINS